MQRRGAKRGEGEKKEEGEWERRRRRASSSTTPLQYRGEEAAKDEDAAAWELHHAGAPINDIDVATLPALLHLSTAMPHHGAALVIPSLNR